MKDFRELLIDNKAYEKDFRQFNRICIGDYELSIQTYKYGYCKPDRALNNLKTYSSMELAIFKNDKMIIVEEDKLFNNFKYLNELLNNKDEGIYGYVPVNVLQELLEYLMCELNIEESEIVIKDITKNSVERSVRHNNERIYMKNNLDGLVDESISFDLEEELGEDLADKIRESWCLEQESSDKEYKELLSEAISEIE